MRKLLIKYNNDKFQGYLWGGDGFLLEYKKAKNLESLLAWLKGWELEYREWANLEIIE